MNGCGRTELANELHVVAVAALDEEKAEYVPDEELIDTFREALLKIATRTDEIITGKP